MEKIDWNNGFRRVFACCFPCCKKKKLVHFRVQQVAQRVPRPTPAFEPHPRHRKLISTEVVDLSQVLRE